MMVERCKFPSKLVCFRGTFVHFWEGNWWSSRAHPREDGWRLGFSAILFGVHPLCVQTVACFWKKAGGGREAMHPKKTTFLEVGGGFKSLYFHPIWGRFLFDSFYSRGWNHQLVEVGWSYLILLMVQKSQTTTWDVSNSMNTGMATTSTGAGFLPSTVPCGVNLHCLERAFAVLSTLPPKTSNPVA